jgi:hypothetical protein
VTGEGCFSINITKSKTHKLGVSVALHFLVIQNIRDRDLLESFSQIFGCGSLFIKEKSAIGTFTVWGFKNIVDNVIPLLEEYPILGAKAEDFKDFEKASVLIKSKARLTTEGLDEILSIKSRMNFKREQKQVV